MTQRERTYPNGEALVGFVEASSFGTFLRAVPEGVALRGWGVLFVATRA